MPRAVKEWIGASPDAKVPPRVRLRIFDAYGGRCQCDCNRKIMVGEKWEIDHYVPLISGGGHRETNLRPLLVEHHKEKTKADVAEKSRAYKRRSRHVGIRKARSPIRGWRKFNGEPVRNPKLGRQ